MFLIKKKTTAPIVDNDDDDVLSDDDFGEFDDDAEEIEYNNNPFSSEQQQEGEEEEEEISSPNSSSTSSSISTLPTSHHNNERIPMLLGYKIYRYNIYTMTYEQIADRHVLSGWTHIYTGVQNNREILGISKLTGSIYRKVIRSSKKYKESDSFLIGKESDDWSDTKMMLRMNNKIYLMGSFQVLELNLKDYTLKRMNKKGLGHTWLKSIYTVCDKLIYGIYTRKTGDMCIISYHFDTEKFSFIGGAQSPTKNRNWINCRGLVCYTPSTLLVFATDGIYEIDTNSGVYRQLNDDEWDIPVGCVTQVDDSHVLLISKGTTWLWDIHSKVVTRGKSGWKQVNCIIPVTVVDQKDSNFLLSGSSNVEFDFD
jgi:hypothetical protein